MLQFASHNLLVLLRKLFLSQLAIVDSAAVVLRHSVQIAQGQSAAAVNSQQSYFLVALVASRLIRLNKGSWYLLGELRRDVLGGFHEKCLLLEGLWLRTGENLLVFSILLISSSTKTVLPAGRTQPVEGFVREETFADAAVAFSRLFRLGEVHRSEELVIKIIRWRFAGA